MESGQIALFAFMKKLNELKDEEKVQLVQNRWNSADSLWEELSKTYELNTRYYDNNPDWLDSLPRKKSKVRSNRIFVDTEAVINTLIANPPKPNFIPTRDTDESRELATTLEGYFNKKYLDRNVKEQLRIGLRNLYFSRLLVLKKFWNAKINDFDTKALDPRKVRMAKYATKEEDSEFVIEEVCDSLLAVCTRFPKKKAEILSKNGYKLEDGGIIPSQVLVENPEITYKEAWIKDRLMCVYGELLLDDVPNPYWDWDGMLITPEEQQQMQNSYGDERRNLIGGIKQQQEERKAPVQEGVSIEGQETLNFQSYYFNHFNFPRKPYIFASVFVRESKPFGDTDMIGQAIPLQASLDERKRDISSNAKIVNGKWMIDSSVMTKAEAQKIQASKDDEAGGLIYGKNVKNGVELKNGNALPQFVFDDMQDSRQEIDNIMAATSAFRGEREGTETKGGRLALVEQSFLRLNELVQVVDYVCYESFNWDYHLAKLRYTEYHYAKTMGMDKALQVLEIIQDDFEDGAEIKIISGKTLPEDKQFMFERAQADVAAGIISPVDYFEQGGYQDPKRLAKNKVMYDINPIVAVGVNPQELQSIQPPPQPTPPPEPLPIKPIDLNPINPN